MIIKTLIDENSKENEKLKISIAQGVGTLIPTFHSDAISKILTSPNLVKEIINNSPFNEVEILSADNKSFILDIEGLCSRFQFNFLDQVKLKQYDSWVPVLGLRGHSLYHFDEREKRVVPSYYFKNDFDENEREKQTKKVPKKTIIQSSFMLTKLIVFYVNEGDESSVKYILNYLTARHQKNVFDLLLLPNVSINDQPLLYFFYSKNKKLVHNFADYFIKFGRSIKATGLSFSKKSFYIAMKEAIRFAIERNDRGAILFFAQWVANFSRFIPELSKCPEMIMDLIVNDHLDPDKLKLAYKYDNFNFLFSCYEILNNSNPKEKKMLLNYRIFL